MTCERHRGTARSGHRERDRRPAGSSPVKLTINCNGYSTNVDGKIDDIRIYDGVLNAAHSKGSPS